MYCSYLPSCELLVLSKLHFLIRNSTKKNNTDKRDSCLNDLLRRDRRFPDPRRPTLPIFTTDIRQLSLAIVPVLATRQRSHALPPPRPASPHPFPLSTLHVASSFHQSRNTPALPNIAPQTELFGTFATANITITGGRPRVSAALGRTAAE